MANSVGEVPSINSIGLLLQWLGGEEQTEVFSMIDFLVVNVIIEFQAFDCLSKIFTQTLPAINYSYYSLSTMGQVYTKLHFTGHKFGTNRGVMKYCE